jgi:hypothetical protein
MSPEPRTSTLYGALPANARLDFVPGSELRRAAGHDEWSRVRALRYDALRARGEIPENPQRAFGDGFDTSRNSVTFLLERNGRLVGSTRSSVSCALRREPLPSSAEFGGEIQAALGEDATVVEASLTLADPAAWVDPKVALFHLFKAHMLHCAAENADWLIVAVREAQMGFYRRMFNMEILTPARGATALAPPRVVMGLEYRVQAPLLFKRLPVLAVEPAEERQFAKSGVVIFRAASR